LRRNFNQIEFKKSDDYSTDLAMDFVEFQVKTQTASFPLQAASLKRGNRGGREDMMPMNIYDYNQ
jgi:hypothetical protein